MRLPGTYSRRAVAGGSAQSPIGALEPLHEPVAAAKQRLVFRLEGAAAFAQGVESGNLLHRPLQAAPQARDDAFEVVGERVDVGTSFHAGGQVPGMALNQTAQRPEVERRATRAAKSACTRRSPTAQRPEVKRRAADLAVVEQVGLYLPRQAAMQHVPDRGSFSVGPGRVQGRVPPAAPSRCACLSRAS